MEVAGLVLSAVPIAITALKCYKAGRNVKDCVRNRKRHIEKLVRALQGHDAAIELYLIWLLKAIGIYEAHHVPGDIPNLMQNDGTVDRIEEYLGEKSSEAFQNAIFECQDSIVTIGKSIEGFLPEKQHGKIGLLVISKKLPEDVNLEFRKGIKLALTKSEVDEQINKLDAATRIIDRLHSASTAIHQIEMTSATRSSKKLADSLKKVRRYANHLYDAIKLGWVPGCHSTHEAMLFLEDRVESDNPSKSFSSRTKPPVTFTLVFSSKLATDSDSLFDEIGVEVLEDEFFEASYAPSLVSRMSQVTISPPPSHHSPRLPSTEVDNICLSINKAKQDNQILQLFLRPDTKFLSDQSPTATTEADKQLESETVSLESLLTVSSQTNDRSKKLTLKARLHLALTLASALLQLSTTPWLANHWNKKNIHFFAPRETVPTPSTQAARPSRSLNSSEVTLAVSEPQAPPDPQPPPPPPPPLLNPSLIDLNRPILAKTFENTESDTPDIQKPPPPPPRHILLELGVMLLELWSDTTLESYCAASGIDPVSSSDYYSRVAIAHRWLDESAEHLLPTYYDATARCVRCHFGGINGDYKWDGGDLEKEIVEGVIEPLKGLCRPRDR